MKKTTVLTSIIGIIFLLLIAQILSSYREMLDFFNTKWILIYSILLSVLYLLFGILIETKRLIKIFTKKLTINWFLLSVVVVLILLTFIPAPYLLQYLAPNFLISYVVGSEINVILNVLAGILLVRSFDNEI